MVEIRIKAHPADQELAAFLSGALPKDGKAGIEGHLADCDECRVKTVSAYEAARAFKNNQKGKARKMKKVNLYLALAVLSFVLSFAMPAYFIQLLVATLICGLKWISDSKSAKMLVMIYEAWKNGGEKEAGRMLNTLQDRITKKI